MRPSPIAVAPTPEGAAAAASRRSPARAAAEAQVCNAFVRRSDTPSCVGTAETRTEARFQLRKKLQLESAQSASQSTGRLLEMLDTGFNFALLLLENGTYEEAVLLFRRIWSCLLYTSPSPRDGLLSRMPSSA